MTYRRPGGLGQAKWVPGQISFMSLPQGQTALPSPQRLLEAGLPIAPYIEHGSFDTGQPSIMRYGRDPYRGIMGIGDSGDGLGFDFQSLALGGAFTIGSIAAFLVGGVGGYYYGRYSQRAEYRYGARHMYRNGRRRRRR